MTHEILTSVVALAGMIGGCWLWTVWDEKRAARKRRERNKYDQW